MKREINTNKANRISRTKSEKAIMGASLTRAPREETSEEKEKKGADEQCSQQASPAAVLESLGQSGRNLKSLQMPRPSP